jgi:hypothetical protein
MMIEKKKCIRGERFRTSSSFSYSLNKPKPANTIMSISRFIIIALLASILALCICAPQVESRSLPAIPTRGSSAHLFNKRDALYNGEATWFQGGKTGSCGFNEADDSFVVALNAHEYGDVSTKSEHCGKSLRITRGDRFVEAVVADYCSECEGVGDLDVTEVVFYTLGGTEDMTTVDIEWLFI